MIERVRNVIKRDAKKAKGVVAVDTPEPKRQKSNNDLLRRYPINQSSSSENRESLEMHAKAIEAELGKAKPRDSILLQLLKSTYEERRMYILNEANSVQSTLVKHRALSRPTVVS